jgi:hypothetical protein
MRHLLAALAIASVLTGCALRPRYADFVSAKTEGKDISFVVTDADTKKPVPGAKVEVSELRNRIIVTTGADGRFTLPIDKKYVSENPVFVVTLPPGVANYELAVAPKPVPVPAPTPVVPTPAPAPVAPPVEATDAGVPSNG